MVPRKPKLIAAAAVPSAKVVVIGSSFIGMELASALKKGKKVEDVTEARLSSRLTDSAACLVGDAYSMSPQLEKLYRASGQPVPHMKRALELNPAHPLVAGLNKAVAAESERETLVPTAQLLYGLALLAEGGELKDPAAFAKTLADSLAAGLD